MYCPKCGTENPDDAELCRSCSWVLTSASTQAAGVATKTSGLAIAALVLGILSPFSGFLTALPAIILGIISLVKIERSGGKLTGKGLAIVGIVLPVVLFPVILIGLLMPALSRVRSQTKAVLCQMNLKQWSRVASMYLNDYDGYFFEDINWEEPLRPYYRDELLLLCPSAMKSQDEGGKIPFAAWVNRDIEGSYGLNYWVINPPLEKPIGPGTPECFWRTSNVRGAVNIPLFFDCSSPGVWPLHTDKPPEYAGQPKGETYKDEMRDCCINRHMGSINIAFLDYSVRKVGLKQLWELKWHRYYGMEGGPTENEWPEWMKKFKDHTRY